MLRTVTHTPRIMQDVPTEVGIVMMWPEIPATSVSNMAKNLPGTFRAALAAPFVVAAVQDCELPLIVEAGPTTQAACFAAHAVRAIRYDHLKRIEDTARRLAGEGAAVIPGDWKAEGLQAVRVTDPQGLSATVPVEVKQETRYAEKITLEFAGGETLEGNVKAYGEETFWDHTMARAPRVPAVVHPVTGEPLSQGSDL